MGAAVLRASELSDRLEERAGSAGRRVCGCSALEGEGADTDNVHELHDKLSRRQCFGWGLFCAPQPLACALGGCSGMAPIFRYALH